jgi:hypothetical protein
MYVLKSVAVLLLLTCAVRASAQEAYEARFYRKLQVRRIIASIENHRGPWNASGRKKDTILLGKTVWELNRRGDMTQSAEYYSADTTKVEYLWKKLLYYNKDSMLFHTESYAAILGGKVQPMPVYTAPKQWREGGVLLTRYFAGERVTPLFTRELRRKLPGKRDRNRATELITTYTFDPDSTLREKEISWVNGWGQVLRYRFYVAHYAGGRPASPLNPASYRYTWRYSSNTTYDRRGNGIHEATQKQGEEGHEQFFRYRYKGAVLLAKDEYDRRGSYLRERYHRYPNGLLRETKVFEGYRPHLLRKTNFQYAYYD